MRSDSEATQTLRAGCSKAHPQKTQPNKQSTNTQTRGGYNTLRRSFAGAQCKYKLTPTH